MDVRVIVYDRTCVRDGGHLTPAWATGAWLYRGVGGIDETIGVGDWSEAFDWLASRPAAIREVQYWGHGKWGSARVGEDCFDASSLGAAHPHRSKLEAVRERLAPDALVWFRTCETLGARPGIDFAERLADFFGARIAGHTHIIGFHQSGLHGLAPGVRADWSELEGVAEGTPERPTKAKGSRPWATRTITCLTGRVPAAWFARPATAP